ncbi:glutamate receptor 10 [Elysia marginata]|uniref:Glutamate receptor 10 n=1 Tax=Elysia marginata TaxID=1093978 RepID=A0AAV4H4U3_9GAST|nr:glutamate receptor 10 [Elysia marginata]
MYLHHFFLTIGAIFDRKDLLSQKAFKFALRRHDDESWSRDPYFKFNASNTVDIIDIEDNFQLASAKPAPLGWPCDQDVIGASPKTLWRVAIRSPFQRRSEEEIQRHAHVSMKDFTLTQRSGKPLLKNRPAWRGAVTKGAKTFEQQRLQVAKTKRAARKAQANCNPTPQATDRNLGLGSASSATSEPTDDPTSQMTTDEDSHLLQRRTNTQAVGEIT